MSLAKRIVFIHPDGLMQIMGTDDGMPSLPVTAEGFAVQGRTVPFASLVRVTSRAAYYKEPLVPATTMGPATITFHPEQR